jgi:hypothetical protein
MRICLATRSDSSLGAPPVQRRLGGGARRWRLVAVERITQSRRRDLRIGCVVLPVLGFLAFFRYVPALADAMSLAPEDEGYLAGPSFFWAIAMLDLGVFLPLTVIACFGLVRGASWAQKVLYTVVGWFGLVGPAVAAMAIATYVNYDPNASAGSALFMTGLGALSPSSRSSSIGRSSAQSSRNRSSPQPKSV